WLWIAVLEVCIGLGLVIFVHELGHFTVAKLCGVKCEKFYLGFDIAGLRLCRFTWGETEYGIGILPLGGYVKMLGQEDNPAGLREEIERAKQTRAQNEGSEPSPEDAPRKTQQAGAGQSRDQEIDVEAAERALFDPRSYLAQSVPRRMAIISAGVVMNLIFAFVVAVFAFQMGVPRTVCEVGGLMPGAGAWQEGVRVGDRIVEVGDRKIEKFRDMREAVSLSDDIEEGIPIFAHRPDPSDPEEYTVQEFKVMPDSSGLLPMIGIFSSSKTALLKEGPVCYPGSAADDTGAFQPGDQIEKIDDQEMQSIVKIDGQQIEIEGQQISSYRRLRAYLALHRDEPITVTVQRAPDSQDGQSGSAPATEPVKIEVLPNPMRRLGLVMKMGKIGAVQAGSPAARAGIKPGERISKIDLEPPADRREPKKLVAPGDPVTLPDRIRRRAGDWIAVLLEGDQQPKYIRVGPADRYDQPMDDDSPISVPELGIAYWVRNQVDHPIKGKAAERAGVPAGAKVVGVRLIAPKEQSASERKLEQRSSVSIDFDEKNRNWPLVIHLLQNVLPTTKVEIDWVKGKQKKTATIDRPYDAEDWPNPDRGFFFDSLEFIQKGKTFGDSTRLAAQETIHATLLVYSTLQKLGTRQVSPKALGGPISIFRWLKHEAEQSFPELLITLTLLSANLAVLNFLPIPLLDGGHMVFLTWEAVRRKPADERVQLALTYLGLVIILSLMIWVIGLDVFRLFSDL
ncbi:MAG: site-2 protease family protein, partial [Planctomycetota bacterium]